MDSERKIDCKHAIYQKFIFIIQTTVSSSRESQMKKIQFSCRNFMFVSVCVCVITTFSCPMVSEFELIEKKIYIYLINDFVRVAQKKKYHYQQY